jgi:hypothetical protein
VLGRPSWRVTRLVTHRSTYRALVASLTSRPTRDAAKSWRMRRTATDRSARCWRSAAANAPGTRGRRPALTVSPVGRDIRGPPQARGGQGELAVYRLLPGQTLQLGGQALIVSPGAPIGPARVSSPKRCS